jgi:hypothetical protein
MDGLNYGYKNNQIYIFLWKKFILDGKFMISLFFVDIEYKLGDFQDIR